MPPPRSGSSAGGFSGGADPAEGSPRALLAAAAAAARSRGATNEGSTPLRKWAKARHTEYGSIQWLVWESMCQSVGVAALAGAIIELDARKNVQNRAALLVSVVAGALNDPTQILEWDRSGARVIESFARPKLREVRYLNVRMPETEAAPEPRTAESLAAATAIDALSESALAALWRSWCDSVDAARFIRAYVEKNPRSRRYLDVYLVPAVVAGTVTIPQEATT